MPQSLRASGERKARAAGQSGTVVVAQHGGDGGGAGAEALAGDDLGDAADGELPLVAEFEDEPVAPGAVRVRGWESARAGAGRSWSRDSS